jgi:hypothetical protein
MILFLQLHDGWCELVIERDLIKPDRDVGEFLHVFIQLINNYSYCRAAGCGLLSTPFSCCLLALLISGAYL